MQILITNDDGVAAPGLWYLVDAVKHLGQVTVVAPDRDCSGVGPSLTMHGPLRVDEHASPIPGVTAYAVNGTPGDTAILGIHEVMDVRPDVVLSGHNAGNNVARDVLLSGTIGAALHGYRNGVTSIALSLHLVDEGSAPLVKELTAQVVEDAVNSQEISLLNVNFPLLDRNACKLHDHSKLADGIIGASEAILAPPRIVDDVVRDVRTNRTFFWNNRRTLDSDHDTLPVDSDLALLREQMVTVTQLTDSLGEVEASAGTRKLIANLDAKIRST
ncbi:MAG: 5'/3'-nucleotidase SurE [Chloroflexi bacterium]|nr:5'/3'-nucleotidase SurE [Chloroflexota bacterium]